MLKDFKAFILRGSVVDLAIGIVIGSAFGAIVSSFVKDILMPPIGLLLNHVDFSNLFITLSGPKTATLVAAQTAGAVTWNYGLFINTIINFLIIALAVFFVIKGIERMRKPAPAPAAAPAPATKECPYCLTTIRLEARRCPNRTSELDS
jgi:large conductance mechanosensitive channel